MDYGVCYPVNRPCLDCRLLTFRLEGPLSFLYKRDSLAPLSEKSVVTAPSDTVSFIVHRHLKQMLIPVRRLCRYFQRSAVFVSVRGLHHDEVGIPAGMRAVSGNGAVCAVTRRKHMIVNFEENVVPTRTTIPSRSRARTSLHWKASENAAAGR